MTASGQWSLRKSSAKAWHSLSIGIQTKLGLTA